MIDIVANVAHGEFIVASYAAAALIVGGLIGRAVIGHRAAMRELAALEMKGAKGIGARRSAMPEARP